MTNGPLRPLPVTILSLALLSVVPTAASEATAAYSCLALDRLVVCWSLEPDQHRFQAELDGAARLTGGIATNTTHTPQLAVSAEGAPGQRMPIGGSVFMLHAACVSGEGAACESASASLDAKWRRTSAHAGAEKHGQEAEASAWAYLAGLASRE